MSILTPLLFVYTTDGTEGIRSADGANNQRKPMPTIMEEDEEKDGEEEEEETEDGLGSMPPHRFSYSIWPNITFGLTPVFLLPQNHPFSLGLRLFLFLTLLSAHRTIYLLPVNPPFSCTSNQNLFLLPQFHSLLLPQDLEATNDGGDELSSKERSSSLNKNTATEEDVEVISAVRNQSEKKRVLPDASTTGIYACISGKP